MEPVDGQFDITGVAPEASIYMYKALDCSGHGGSDNIAAAMLTAQQDGVDIVSMSLGTGAQPFDDEVDPLATISASLANAGVAVIVAAANDAIRGKYALNLYTDEEPSSIPGNIAVGATAIEEFPLVYTAVDSLGARIRYASIFPLDFPNGANVYMLDDACNSNDWNSALAAIKDINNTIIAFQVSGSGCSYSEIAIWNSASQTPVILMAFNSNETDPYFQTYNTPSQGYFGTVEFTNVNNVDGAVLAANYAAAGGYLSYKLTFEDKSFQSVPAASGGYVDWYSNFGPTWHTYNLKPQFAAPGGHALSTWPLGVLGGWCILSGTSMATPYAAASFALVKSQHPDATNEQIKDMLQTNANPLPWIYDTGILSATAQQGAGAINVYDAIFAQTAISPGELKVGDVSRTEYGTGNFTITNKSGKSQIYTLSHEGAGYTDYRLSYMEVSQQANHGSATFDTPTVTIPDGESADITFSSSYTSHFPSPSFRSLPALIQFTITNIPQ